MKTLKATLGLFLLSSVLFSFTPAQAQPVAQGNDTVVEQVQLQKVYESEQLTGEDQKAKGKGR